MSRVYKFPLQHTLLSIFLVITHILAVAMEMPLMMASNRIISFFSLPPNEEMVTQVHRPLGIPEICFSQSVKSQKNTCKYFYIYFWHRRVPKLLRFFDEPSTYKMWRASSPAISQKHSKQTFLLSFPSWFSVSKSCTCHRLWGAFPDCIPHNWFPSCFPTELETIPYVSITCCWDPIHSTGVY